VGILSASVSITRYKVDGKLKGTISDTVSAGLKKNVIQEIDQSANEKAVGWTSTEQPFIPDFEGSSFIIGAYLIFSLRIDQKKVPTKVVQKYTALETVKKLSKTGRKFLSRDERRIIKDSVLSLLYQQTPATPAIFDIVWNYEEGWLWFFSNLKGANETIESHFLESFGLTLVRLFPYTSALLLSGLSDDQKDILGNLSPEGFLEQ
jgi:recombination associated protein RdgC